MTKGTVFGMHRLSTCLVGARKAAAMLPERAGKDDAHVQELVGAASTHLVRLLNEAAETTDRLRRELRVAIAGEGEDA